MSTSLDKKSSFNVDIISVGDHAVGVVLEESEPINPVRVVQLARSIINSTDGDVIFDTHCNERMKERGITQADCINTVRGGRHEMDNFEQGSWRYQTGTNRFVVVVTFEDENEFWFLTCWRKK